MLMQTICYRPFNYCRFIFPCSISIKRHVVKVESLWKAIAFTRIFLKQLELIPISVFYSTIKVNDDPLLVIKILRTLPMLGNSQWNETVGKRCFKFSPAKETSGSLAGSVEFSFFLFILAVLFGPAFPG